MQPHISALSTLAIVVLFVPSGRADTLKVPSATFPTIASAVAAAHQGDTIQIGPNNADGSGGTYFENVVVPNTVTGLHFKGASVTWDGGANGNILTFTGPNDGVTVEGFEFKNGLAHVVITGDNATITRCQSIHSLNAAALQITGDFAKVTNVKVEGGVGDGIRVSGTDAIIDQCAIEARTGPGVDLIAADRASVSKCKIAGCDVGILAAGDDLKLLKNTIAGIGSDAIRATGKRADIEGNKIQFGGEEGIQLNAGSEDAKILGNKISSIAGIGIRVNGAHATISKNRVETASGGIEVTNGNTAILGGPTITANTIKNLNFGDGIGVQADSVTILGNTIENVFGDDDGIDVFKLGVGAQGGSISSNKLTNIFNNGVLLSGNSIAVSANTATRCGRGVSTHAGFHIDGNFNTVVGNTASDIIGDGYLVIGNSTTVTNCKALNCRGDGFDIDVTCDTVTVDGCTAIGCDAEGLDNSDGAIATSVKNCEFSKCRIDFAGNGTLAQSVNNKFKTGGPSKAPEID